MDHLPRYQYDADERTRYEVRIEWRDQFSVEPTVETLVGNDTLEEAQRAYILKRDQLNLGASQMGRGDVFDERGQHIAQISYNGRLWHVHPSGYDDKFFAEAPPIDKDKLYASVRRLHNVVSPNHLKDLSIQMTEISEEAITFLREITNAVMRQEELQPSMINKDIPRGNENEIEVLVCSEDAMTNLFGAPWGSLGIHVIDAPDTDPFREGTPHSLKLRIAIAWDNEKVRERLDWNAVTEMDRLANAEAWLNTIAHELLHVKLFAENGNFNTPADLDSMSNEIGHDLFDMSTGYGIRGLRVNDKHQVADEMTEAHELMEEYCEETGREVTSRALGTYAAEKLLKIIDAETPAPSPGMK